ncbi:hypothetical protein CON65_08230 [Bacillus pseudomycoides]|uniref:DUF3888 domain-containing protein n=1 Tax=Bacillus pseudomycoides TaxID=64104 RepID=A0AA91VFE3_9BACI|nr:MULTISPECIES: DUF3888 domain-containing protein [Bacillus]PEB52703.1 hypothetical protein COO03_11510 [Bacillus sp. AFS098217]PED83165.1 hypothetical protein CON65_08230 [Bacillus pseudomycoides]PEU14018.1 hypothetical protein CN524_10640 [Bacillus sp. AFS019443]PEU18763.1 hypothetical protein CN525_09325 [Bacillus sp. AFS014408]PFW62350.1 hypothetical protein COL20_13795 [Bacillus sp. AFS075034]
MKKLLCFVLCSGLIMFSSPVVITAQYDLPLMEDALYSVLFPQINAAIEKHYGKLKPYDCPKIVSIKKLYSGTYLFQAVIEVTKYESGIGGKVLPPFEKISITFNNEEGEWIVTKVAIKRLPNDTKLNCKKTI